MLAQQLSGGRKNKLRFANYNVRWPWECSLTPHFYSHYTSNVSGNPVALFSVIQKVAASYHLQCYYSVPVMFIISLLILQQISTRLPFLPFSTAVCSQMASSDALEAKSRFQRSFAPNSPMTHNLLDKSRALAFANKVLQHLTQDDSLNPSYFLPGSLCPSQTPTSGP